MLAKLLSWQPRVEKSLFQFLLLDNYLKTETLTLLKNNSFISHVIVTDLQILYSCSFFVILI